MLKQPMQARRSCLLFSLILLASVSIRCEKEEEKRSEKTAVEVTSRKASVEKAALSFYDWYLKAHNTPDNEVAVDASISEGKNGKCHLDTEPYFDQLRKLGTVSAKFLEKETARFEDCAAFVATIDYQKFKSAEFEEASENGQFAYFCDSFDHYYWIRSQEPYASCSARNIRFSSENVATVDISFAHSGQQAGAPLSRVSLELEDGKWMITGITFLDSKKPERIGVVNSWDNFSVGLEIGKEQMVILFHGQCAGTYPVKRIADDAVEMIWADDMDCVFDAGLKNDFGLSRKPEIGKPFVRFTPRGKVLHAEYYYPEWVEKYAEQINAEIFTEKYLLKKE